VGNQRGEKVRIGGFIVNKTRQIGVGMTTNIGRGGKEMNTTATKRETGPHTCQEALGSVVFDIIDKEVPYMEG